MDPFMSFSVLMGPYLSLLVFMSLDVSLWSLCFLVGPNVSLLVLMRA